MPRPRKAIRPIEKNISLPEDIVARVDLELFSEVEGKVPFGAWQRYVEGLIRADLERRAQGKGAHPAAVHCDNCGCDWLDNGLNPVGCPYCVRRC